jgi:thioredoxin 1
MAAPIVLTDENFQAEVLESAQPVLVDFWATWCGPCRMIAPIVEQLSDEYDGKAKVGKLDVDTAQKTAQEFGIRSIPTLLLFKEGKVTEQIIGAVAKQQIVDKLNAALAS